MPLHSRVVFLRWGLLNLRLWHRFRSCLRSSARFVTLAIPIAISMRGSRLVLFSSVPLILATPAFTWRPTPISDQEDLRNLFSTQVTGLCRWPTSLNCVVNDGIFPLISWCLVPVAPCWATRTANWGLRDWPCRLERAVPSARFGMSMML